MKAYYKLLIVPLLIATACSPSYVGTSAFQDDIYYVPGEESLIDKEMAVYTTKPVTQEPIIQQTTKAVPTTKATFGDDRDFQQIQGQYREMLASDTIETIDTTYYNDEQGYFIGEFNGTDSDLDEIERLRQWYPQGFGYYDNSGYNLAMMLAGDSDWNVYVEGDKVWWTPTWTNFNHYNSFNFSPIRYGRHFAYNSHNYGSSFGFGFGSGFGFGIGHGYHDNYYWGSNYGYGYPYYNNYSNYGYYGHNHNYGYAKQSKNYYGPRKSMGSKAGTSRAYTNRSAVSKTKATNRVNRSAGYKSGTANRVNRSAGYTKSGTTTRRSATTAKDAVRRSTAAQRYGNRNSRSSYGNRAGTTTRRVNTTGTARRSNYKGTTTRYGTQNRSTYRGTKSGTTVKRRPSNYTKPRSNSRPSYNKSGTKRSNNVRSSGTRSSKYSKVKSTPTYRKSSTRSSRSSSSSYKPSRSSSSRSSGSVRSSGSSSRSSSGTRRSSGGTTRRR